jgi:hypothetical protein
MNEQEFQDLLLDAVDAELDGCRSVKSFEESGLLGSDAGLVIRMKDGSEFQVTIVQSRGGKDNEG